MMVEMDLDKIKKIAARTMKVGVNRVWINPEETENVSEAMTKDDIRELIKDGAIKKRKIQGQSRARARVLAEKKKKGR